METIEEVKLEIGKKYSFPVCSTTTVEVVATIEHWIVFHEDRMQWRGRYDAIWKEEENEEMGTKSDVPRKHSWMSFYKKSSMSGAEVYRRHDEGLWGVKIFNVSAHDIIMVFEKEKDAKVMLERIVKFIFS